MSDRDDMPGTEPENRKPGLIPEDVLRWIIRAWKAFVNFLKKGGWLIFVGFFADLISKMVMEYGYPETRISLISDSSGNNILGIYLTHNQGMGYGLLSGQRVLLAVLSGVVGVGLCIFLAYRFDRKTPTLRYALYLLISGCFGNFIDRAFYSSGVIDWIWVGNSNWPSAFTYVCNIADILLTAGVIVLIVGVILIAVRDARASKVKKAAAKGNSSEDAPSTTEDIQASEGDVHPIEESDIDSLKRGLEGYIGHADSSSEDTSKESVKDEDSSETDSSEKNEVESDGDQEDRG